MAWRTSVRADGRTATHTGGVADALALLVHYHHCHHQRNEDSANGAADNSPYGE